MPHYERCLWIIGPSSSGKSTLAQSLGLSVIECGALARSEHHPDATVEEISFSSVEALGKDHRHFSKYIKERLSEAPKPCVVVGARNPVDFIDNFDPHRDGVVIFEGPPASDFERFGLRAIEEVVVFMASLGILSRGNVVRL